MLYLPLPLQENKEQRERGHLGVLRHTHILAWEKARCIAWCKCHKLFLVMGGCLSRRLKSVYICLSPVLVELAAGGALPMV